MVSERITVEKEGRLYTYKLLFDEDQEVNTRKNKVEETPKKGTFNHLSSFFLKMLIIK